MFKTRAINTHNGTQYEKMFVAGSIIKCEIKRGKLMITLSSFKGNKEYEFTNDIIVSDAKKAEKIKSLKKYTQLFCDINISKTTYNDKPIENLYLFNFEIGKEGQGDLIFNAPAAENTNNNANGNPNRSGGGMFPGEGC